MKKVLVFILGAAFYFSATFVFYKLLPPRSYIEIVLDPAKYIHVQEELVTRSRISQVVLIPTNDQAREDLQANYTACQDNLGYIGVEHKISVSNPKPYRYVISAPQAEVYRERIDCAIQLVIEKHNSLLQFLLSSRQVTPPGSQEKLKATLIHVKDLSEDSIVKALIRAGILGLILVALAIVLLKTLIGHLQKRARF